MSALNNSAFESKLENNLQQKLETGLVEDEAILLGKQNRGLSGGNLNQNFQGQQFQNQQFAQQGLAGQNFQEQQLLNQEYAQQGLAGQNFQGQQFQNQQFAQQGLAGQNFAQTGYVQSNQRASLGLVRAQPTVLETIQKDVVIQERIHPIQKEEIQPIIYREREQLDVKQVTQMMHETQIQPTIIQQRELPAQTREAVVERGAAIQENYIAATREVDMVQRTQVVHAPIVNEIIKKTIIEEIQPVLERDIIQSTVIQNTQPIYEKIVEAPTVYRETIVTAQERGIIGGDLAALEAQGFNLGVAGQRLSQGYTSNYASTGLNSGLAGQQGLNSGFAGQQGLNSGLNSGFAGQQGLNSGFAGQQGLANETLLTSNGMKRRSLVEALPASYSYLGQQNQGLNSGLVDTKIAEQEMLAGSAATNSALPAKTVL